MVSPSAPQPPGVEGMGNVCPPSAPSRRGMVGKACDECGLVKPKPAMCRLYRGRLRCKECKRAGDNAAMVVWRQANKDRDRQYHNQYHKKNRDSILAYRRGWRARRKMVKAQWETRADFERWCREDNFSESLHFDRACDLPIND